MLSFCTLFKNLYYCSVAAPIVNWFFPHISSRKYICDSWLSLSCISRKGPNLVLGRPTYQDRLQQGCRDGSLAKSTYCSSRYLNLVTSTHNGWLTTTCKFNSRFTASTLWGPLNSYAHTYRRHTHIHIIKKYIIEKMTSFSSIECFWFH